jgi:hypothetical protein
VVQHVRSYLRHRRLAPPKSRRKRIRGYYRRVKKPYRIIVTVRQSRNGKFETFDIIGYFRTKKEAHLTEQQIHDDFRARVNPNAVISFSEIMRA